MKKILWSLVLILFFLKCKDVGDALFSCKASCDDDYDSCIESHFKSEFQCSRERKICYDECEDDDEE